ncbi:MAG: ornithine carbamoyltransferase [Rhodospirillales bacterium]|nr:ornithine carbamoyltransferase [Alphaproteobacteria bacterium]MCB1839967.1 ornithine carbamoyltransferase [Alphaproteobacteria bacterium]MCB9976262.1 ornithine carbamoyltransferase [Rhodospirillales bacterium]
MSIRHFINLPEIGPETLKGILEHAHALKREKYNPPQILEGLSLVMAFDKRSTRTRLSFEVAMKQLGGHTIVMNMGEMQIAGSETIEDTAKVLSRFVDAVMLRMSSHEMMEELARWSTIPIINGMTDESHPCQIMADLLTIEEKLGAIEGKKIAWFGDYNNVCKTFAQAAPIFGFDLVISTPPDLKPEKTTADVIYQEDAKAAAKDADVLVTDTWVSMGQEGKSIEKFMPYQVNSALMALAKDGAIFMHCMPIHQNEEVTPEVLKTPASVIYDEAENRLHAQKAILAWCLEEAGVRVRKSA